MTPCRLWYYGLTHPAAAVDVKDVRLWRAPDHTRIVFDLTGPVDHKLIPLDNPSRIVIDIENTRLKADLSDISLEKTPVSRIRSGVRDGDDLRVVLDMGATVKPRSFVLRANEQAGDRLVLDLYDKESGKGTVRKSVRQSSKRDIVIAIDAGRRSTV